MLSPPLAPPSQQSSDISISAQSPTTRRRGLSYLRNLSSRDHHSPNLSADSSRISPRQFFVRSTSYQETKDTRAPNGRRRSQSHSRPHVVAAANVTSAPLARVASERGGATQAETAPSSSESIDMARTRTATSSAQAGSAEAGPTMTRTGTNGELAESKPGLPTIRLFPHQDNNRAGRPSLNFSPISRTLPSEQSTIRVGRYSEREGPPTANPTVPSDAAIGFKSKVVSRKHCEFSFVDGQWQIRDAASSSGTFLNHIRLSQPNQESRLYPVKDGDIVQLGIDFRGGEEMIFRCVKIRIECNRSWQKKPNNFNKQRQAQLRGLAKDQPSADSNSSECSICLGNVLPCQFLFVAPCAHAWHYKCIRPMLEGRNSYYPQFQCPNCRAYADLEADVDVNMEDWAEEESADQDKDLQIDQSARPGTAANSHVIYDDSEPALAAAETTSNGSADETHITEVAPHIHTSLSNSSLLARRQDRITSPAGGNLSPPVQTIPMPARPTETEMHHILAQQRTQTESPNADQIIAGEGPLTPRNNAGPFVFDGSGSRMGSRRHLNVPSQSLDEVSSDGIE